MSESSPLSVIQAQRVVKKVPKGTSEYQAAWIMDSEGSDEVRSQAWLETIF